MDFDANIDQSKIGNLESEPQREQPVSQARKIGSGLIVTIVIISVLVGMFSGAAGALIVTRTAKSPAIGQNTIINEDSAIIDVVKKASPAVVSIVISKNLDQNQSDLFSNPFFFDPFFQQRQPSTPNNSTPNYQQVGAGSGFFISSDGLILTNKHVVSDATAKYSVFTNDGKSYDATVVAQDPINDLALVKIKISNAPTLSFADSSKIEIGERVIAIGNSLGQYHNTVTSGIVSGINRDVTAGGEGVSEQLEGVIQTDAAINPGNSGGPLLNIEGRVVGLNTAIDQQGQLVGFAIPSNDANKDVQNYRQFGQIKKAFLGVRYVVLTPALKDQFKLPTDSGAWVTTQGDTTDTTPSVVAGSAADKAGIKDGDIITALNGTSLDQNTTLAGLIKNFNPGDTINLTVLRDGKTLNVSVTLGEK